MPATSGVAGPAHTTPVYMDVDASDVFPGPQLAPEPAASAASTAAAPLEPAIACSGPFSVSDAASPFLQGVMLDCLPGVFGWLRLQRRPRSQPASSVKSLHRGFCCGPPFPALSPFPFGGATAVHYHPSLSPDFLSYLSGHPCLGAPLNCQYG
eukprot:3685957-Amphidinium_carterae.2